MNRPGLAVFLILWGSYACFWHGRDWNTASRLMLTYAIVDRGTIRLDGLDDQTGDKARYLGHFYSDKLPGLSFLAVPPTIAAKAAFGLPDHPLNRAGFAHWPTDYWATLFTSGLATAVAGATLAGLAGALGCGPRRATLIGLAYGLATPAYAYATLAYGHQVAAACLLGAFALLWREPRGRVEIPSGWAGFLASYASLVEIQVGPVSAILGVYALALSIGRKRPWAGVIAFGLGAIGPALVLVAYNVFAFDSPFRMGYFYHATERFADVHSASNPLGLTRPAWGRLADLTLRPARGLLWYAPIVALSVPGFVRLIRLGTIGMAAVCGATIAAVGLVNLSYPEWSGGWSTGPRLLVTLLPFALLPVAGWIGGTGPGRRARVGIAAVLAVAGWVVVTLFQGVGARVPDPAPSVPPGMVDPLATPLVSAVLPIWRGEALPGWVFGRRFARNAVSLARPGWVASLPEGREWVQFAPIVLGQGVAVGLALLLMRGATIRPPTGPGHPTGPPPPPRPDRG